MRDATRAAREAVLALGEDGTKVVGTGASGDTTLLADRAAEEAIMERLGSEQGVRFLSEEAGRVGDVPAQVVAVIDPLDGSSNYSRGVPFYCTSVAVASGDCLSSVEAAMILDLVRGDEYFAARGSGAEKNGAAIHTSAASILQESVAGLDLSGLKGEGVAMSMKVVEGTRRQLHLGANALELSMLASGVLDCFVDLRGKMRVTDVAAALLIVKEAGGLFSTPGGSTLDPSLDLDERVSVVASANARLHRQLTRALSSP